ncbi:hypothetical protein [Algoriphagus sp. NG3]|uniref:hypothetical protein n=1 Tax=Algoriphagus sp. NG3 TaxID=3097546 RepID=UPI002A82ACFE|nr:hypothetical protein [Algoriphagus sp. NG3]WPR76061.1 hypothetical protein SLW71_01695 [Algoriphagus sp. NG3]
MSYFEDNCTAPGWTSGSVPAPYTCSNNQGVKSANDYQNSGKYVQVCTESEANVAFSQLNSGDHSAVRQVVGGSVVKYLSKYGTDGPLVAHNLNQSFYHLGGQVIGSPKFWSFVGGIIGSPNIAGTSPVSFSVLNKPGVTYSWSIPNGYSNIVVSSGSSQNSVTLTPTHSGTATLRLSISSPCGSVKTQEISLTIQTNICLEGTFSQGIYTGLNLNTVNQVGTGNITSTVNCPNSTLLTWQRTSGSIITYTTSGGYVNFNMTSGGTISYLVTAKSGSVTLSTRNVAFYNFGSFAVYPNPSSGSIRLDQNKDLTFGITIQSLESTRKIDLEGYRGGSEINTTMLDPGEYVLSVLHEGKVLNQQRIIISK